MIFDSPTNEKNQVEGSPASAHSILLISPITFFYVHVPVHNNQRQLPLPPLRRPQSYVIHLLLWFLAQHGGIRHPLCHRHPVGPREGVELDVLIGVLHRFLDLFYLLAEVAHQRVYYALQ